MGDRENHVDLYLCGEVHAITCIERDGLQQIAHGGLFGYNSKVNYLVGKIRGGEMDLILKEIEIICEGEKLWQVGNNRPGKFVTIADPVKKRGSTEIGSMRIEKTAGKRLFGKKTGYFVEMNNP